MPPLRGQRREGAPSRAMLPPCQLTSSPQRWRRALRAPTKGGTLKHEARNVSVAVCTYQLAITGSQLETALTTTVLAPLIYFCYCYKRYTQTRGVCVSILSEKRFFPSPHPLPQIKFTNVLFVNLASFRLTSFCQET